MCGIMFNLELREPTSGTHSASFLRVCERVQRNPRSDAVTPGTVGDVVSNA